MTASGKVRIVVGPSRILVAALGLAHLGALAVTLVVVVPAWGKLLIATALVASGAISICRSALQRGGSALVELEVEEGSRVSCCTRDEQWREGTCVLPAQHLRGNLVCGEQGRSTLGTGRRIHAASAYAVQEAFYE